MIVYAVESLATTRDEVEGFSRQHWEELALSKDKIFLNMDWPRYAEMERLGILKIITIRKDGVLIGYYYGWLAENPHYKGYAMMFTDFYYLDPPHRKGFTGIRLFRFLEERCREWGVVKMVTVTKLHRDKGKLFSFLGWTEVERTFTKYIGPN